MKPEFGATVIDNEGNTLGQINYIINDTWTGELKSILIRKEHPRKDIVIPATDIAQVGEGKVYLKSSLADIENRQA